MTTLMMCLARLGLHLSGRRIGPCTRPMWPSRTCRTLTASSSGRNSRAAMAAARPWCGKATTSNGGFSSAADRPWLPVSHEHLRPLRPRAQEAGPRRADPPLPARDCVPPCPQGAGSRATHDGVQVPRPTWCISRRTFGAEDDTLFCAFNLSGRRPPDRAAGRASGSHRAGAGIRPSIRRMAHCIWGRGIHRASRWQPL